MTIPAFRLDVQRLGTLGRLALLAPCVATACVKELPPAATPDAVVPAAAAGAPPAPDQGRLVVDVVEGPTRVERVRMSPRPRSGGQAGVELVESRELLCAATPCVLDLRPENVALAFPVLGDPDEHDVELVHVGPETSVYRRSLGVYRDETGGLRVFGIIATSLGGASAITGLVLLPIGLEEGRDGLTVAGGVTLGVGAALVALGIWAMRRDAPTFRPGSANHFVVPAPATGGE